MFAVQRTDGKLFNGYGWDGTTWEPLFDSSQLRIFPYPEIAQQVIDSNLWVDCKVVEVRFE